jgi:hypothetical protein
MLWYHTWVVADDKQVKDMAHFYIGCAVWAYKDWLGELFPAGSKSSDFLSLYSSRLTTVEGNTTFYETNLFYFSVLPRRGVAQATGYMDCYCQT